MPNWKKVIVSGSDAILSNITASSNISASGYVSASYFIGNGSQLTNLPSQDPFPFTGSAIISGSLEVEGDTRLTGSLSVSGSGISFIASGGTVFSISETGSFTLGEGATAANDTAVAIGKNANATSNGVSIGGNSNASLGNTISIGGYSGVTGQTGIAIGYDADVSGYSAIGIGAYINNSAGRSVVFNATGENTVNHSKASASAFYMTSKTIPDFEFVAGGTSTLANSNLSGSATSTASFGTYLGDGSQLTGIAAGGTNLTQSIFVTQNGDDTTGTIGNMSKPFATLESASQAATTGSTIFVYPGLYEPVSGSNLAFEGGAYYFFPNTVVSKSTDGDIFDATGITTGFSVYGQAEFYTYNNADRIMYFGDGTGAWPGTPYNWVFECKDFKAEGADAFKGHVSNQSGDFLIPGDHTACFKFSNGISTGGHVFNLPGLNKSPYNTGGIIRIDANRIESTAGSGVSVYYGGTTLYVTANEVTGTIYGIGSVYYQNLYADIENCYGGTAAYQLAAGSRATISGKANKIIQSSGVVSHQGDLDTLEISGGQFAGNLVRAATISGGEINFAWDTIGNYNAPITITGGTANVSLQGSNAYTAPINVNGGKLYLNGFQFGQNSYGDITINGGELIFDGKLDRPTINYQSGGRWCFQLISGTLRLRGYVNNSIHTGTNSHEASCVRYEGGTLILDGCTLTTSASFAPPVHVIGQNREAKIYSGGVNTNKTGSMGLLAASSSFGSGGYALTNPLGGMIIEDASVE